VRAAALNPMPSVRALSTCQITLTGVEVIEEFKALYYQGLRAAACKINQQIAS
jgi:hypothetical protein